MFIFTRVLLSDLTAPNASDRLNCYYNFNMWSKYGLNLDFQKY